MKAIESNRNLSDFLKAYRYQPELTGRLDRLDSQPFTQAVVNEIVLWKVNRYASLSPTTLELLNSVVGLQPGSHRAARDVILALLGERGVDLPMASTLLRFRNPSTFQIIDHRAYRALYGETLRLRGSEQAKAKLYLLGSHNIVTTRLDCGMSAVPAPRLHPNARDFI
jgi:hypothetical protein